MHGRQSSPSLNLSRWWQTNGAVDASIILDAFVTQFSFEVWSAFTRPRHRASAMSTPYNNAGIISIISQRQPSQERRKREIWQTFATNGSVAIETRPSLWTLTAYTATPLWLADTLAWYDACSMITSGEANCWKWKFWRNLNDECVTKCLTYPMNNQ